MDQPGNKVIRASIRVVIRVGAYALSATVAGAFYTSLLLAKLSFSQPISFRDGFSGVLLFFIVGSFLAALALMTLPWILAVWTYRRAGLPGPAYFTCTGALLMVLAGSATSSLAPKPLFIEDQTFMQGALIAFERQGICLAFAGAILGLGYWFLAERRWSSQTLFGRHDTLVPRS